MLLASFYLVLKFKLLFLISGYDEVLYGAYYNSLNYFQSDNDARDKGAEVTTPNLDSHSGKLDDDKRNKEAHNSH